MEHRRRAVVIIEDDRDIAQLQRVLLEDVADVVLITDDFRRTLLPETWLRVDVAVIDLMLPDVDGEDICRYLMENHSQIRRVVCTAKPVSQLVDLVPLADVVLLKPFRPSDFVYAVLGSS